jgi:hypothetical protein
MDLTVFFQICVSVFCIVATLFLIIIIVNAVLLRLRLNKLINSLEQIAQNAAMSSDGIKEFIERTISSVERFKSMYFTYEALWKTATDVISLIKNRSLTNGNKKNQTKQPKTKQQKANSKEKR